MRFSVYYSALIVAVETMLTAQANMLDNELDLVAADTRVQHDATETSTIDAITQAIACEAEQTPQEAEDSAEREEPAIVIEAELAVHKKPEKRDGRDAEIQK